MAGFMAGNLALLQRISLAGQSTLPRLLFRLEISIIRKSIKTKSTLMALRLNTFSQAGLEVKV
jgi:hypothetical protein